MACYIAFFVSLDPVGRSSCRSSEAKHRILIIRLGMALSMERIGTGTPRG